MYTWSRNYLSLLSLFLFCSLFCTASSILSEVFILNFWFKKSIHNNNNIFTIKLIDEVFKFEFYILRSFRLDFISTHENVTEIISFSKNHFLQLKYEIIIQLMNFIATIIILDIHISNIILSYKKFKIRISEY